MLLKIDKNWTMERGKPKSRHINQDGTAGLDATKPASYYKANVINLNLIVLKEHVLRQDTFCYGYILATVDLVIELLVHSRRGVPQPIPMALIAIFDEADARLKKLKDNRTKNEDREKKRESIKKFTRGYVKLWCTLLHYIAHRFDYAMAEYIMIEAYNRMAAHKYDIRKQ